jgi:hypothetical protein
VKTVKMTCLANSWRHGGRCVAGVVEEEGSRKWLRPVGSGASEALAAADYTMDSGQEPRPFDNVEIELGDSVATAAQPENYLVTPAQWKFLGEVEESSQAAILDALDTRGHALFGGTGPSIDATTISQAPPGYSLTIARPKDLRWELRPRDVGNLQLRAHFTLGTNFYDLPVTDPIWYENVRGQPPGGVSAEALGEVPPPSHFTVSLGEQWAGIHYKIVAAVHSVQG